MSLRLLPLRFLPFLFPLPALLGLCQPGVAQSIDPRAGVWTLVSAESSLDPPNRLSITPLNGGMHVVMSGETHLDFSASPNGHAAPAPGNLGFDQVTLHMFNRKQAEVKQKKGGALVATIDERVSKDGNELTSTTKTLGHPDQVTVWTRTGGAKVAKDPFAGEWTEDLGKTRLHQASVLKIEPDGTGGVRFLSDYSYTARVDGKPYDVKNSRNDTVTLALADPHTVDATYRRDGQVTQKDRWVVSADGRQMTLASSATLETGQHVTEKLAFRKQ